jgi:ABC-type dipeptide/oligopeptide/nickel transport system ATPase component
VVVLADGEVVEEGAAKEVLTNPQHPATRALLQIATRT